MDFESYILKLKDDLTANDKIELISFHCSEPVSKEQYAACLQRFKLFIPQVVADFYSVCNGLQVRWRKKKKENLYEEEIKAAGNSFKWDWPAEHYWQLDGLINILPLEQFLFGEYKDFMWFEYEEKYNINFMNNQINLREFKQRLRPFDVFDKYYTVAGYATTDAFYMLLGDDHNADFMHYVPISAEKYFEQLFLTKGAVKKRPDFFK